MLDIIKSIDWTQVVVALMSIGIAVLVKTIAKYAVPWLKQNNLYEAAKIAVNAAESAYGRYNGSQKIEFALNTLKEQGWNIDSKEVINAIESAWQELDLKMIEANVKEPEKLTKTTEAK